MTKHIHYIDGLKGFCALFVIIYHYLLAFGIEGYVGWESGIALQDKWGYFWSCFPLSILGNINYVLYMFFTLIAFIPAYIFFHRQDKQWLQKQALIRYFRFMPYTLSIILISYFFYSQEWYLTQELGNVLQEPWNTAIFSNTLTLSDALWTGLFGAMIVGASDYVSSLWCMHIIFIGSYVAYAIIFFFAQIQHRYLVYAFLWLLLYSAPLYAFFVIGVAVADMLNTKNTIITRKHCKILFSFGLISVILGEAPWYALATSFTYASFMQYFLQTFGIFSILISLCQSEVLQKFFTHKIFLHCSRYCFEYILTHIIILFSISAWIFLQIHTHWGYSMAFIIAGITAIPLNYMAAVTFGKLLQPLTTWLSQKVYVFFVPK